MGQSAITLESHLCGKGASFDEIFSATTTELTTTTAAFFRASINSEFAWDDIRLIAGTRSTVETFTHNNANEQLTHTKNGVTTDMEYDAWGRLTKRDDGTHEATYAYRYGSKLYNVTSDFPGEGSVTYETGGDQKRRSRVAGVEETWYNYTVGFDVVSTEDDADGSSGALAMTNVVVTPTAQVSATLGDLAGTTPASGTARYYAFDHLGSTRSAWNASKVKVGNYGFDAYGGEFAHAGGALSSLAGTYTGKPWDATAKLFHFPYRQYSPDTARWTTRDPLGMVDGPNVRIYVLGSPVAGRDMLGLLVVIPGYPPPPLSDCYLSARRIFAEEESIRGWVQGEHASRNAMRHCMGMCRLTKEEGVCCSFVAGWAHELISELPYVGGSLTQEDLNANRHGRRCGTSRRDCESCCSFYASLF